MEENYELKGSETKDAGSGQKNIALTRIASFIRIFTWEDAVFIVMLAMLLIINANLLSSLQQLPSPIYGGDYYNHLGSLEHIYQGGSIFENGQLPGEVPWVPWLYHLLVVMFAKLFGLGVLSANIHFSLVALALGVLLMYALASVFFKDKAYGLISALWIASYFPIFKYSPFSFYVVLPAFMLACLLFLKKGTWLYAVLLGIVYGIAGLSNTYMFICTTIFFMFFLPYYAVLRNVKIKELAKLLKFESPEFKAVSKDILKGVLIFIIGFLISLLWWYHPIFTYHAQTPNDMQIYGFNEVKGLSGMTGLVLEGLRGELFRYGAGLVIIMPVVTFLGLLILLFLKKKTEEHKLLLIFVLAALFCLFIHFITLPLLGTLMASGGLFSVLMIITAWLIFLVAIRFFGSKLSRINKHLPSALLIVVMLFVLWHFISHVNGMDKDPWWGVGKSPMPSLFVGMREWMLENTDLDDVFLTTNEDSFAINAVSGRKVVTYRRTHAPPYTDMNQRMLDAGIMLYAQNNEDREDLLRKYSVDYIYWQPGWVSNEFRFDQNGQIQGLFDPLSIDYSPEREAVLIRNNVTYVRMSWYMDPAWSPTYPKRDLLIIMLGRASIEKPWSEQLDKYLVLEHEVLIGGQVAARIYKVNLTE